MTETLRECASLANSIHHNTITVMQRPGKENRQKLLELVFDFNEKLGKLNDETIEILNDDSWRNKK